MVAALPPNLKSLERMAAMYVREHELEVECFRVQVAEGPDRDREVESEGAELAIGGAEGNQLVLADPMVGRFHCLISATPEGFVLRDLGTPGGTTLGGFRVREALLEPGAIIGVGRSRLIFERVGRQLRQPLSRALRFGPVIGESPAMRRVFAQLERVASGDTAVLIGGEAGTGKSLLAEALHAHSGRARQALVVVDCAAISPQRLEAELFGEEQGVDSRIGRLESARGGTVFLDEIAELPLELQAKLARVLERRVLRRAGSLEPVPVDVRIIAASARHLQKDVNRGLFRSDLLAALATTSVTLPPLRERREDLPALVTAFWEQASGAVTGPTAALLATLARADWPGNVRQLRQAVERAVAADGVSAAARATTIPDAPLPRAASPAPEAIFDPNQSFRTSKEAVVTRWERSYLVDLVRRCRGNVSRAARAARMDRNHLRDLLRRHNIDANEVDE
jgi:DNA-binding NtrC family response regulator